jgi:predicted Zn-dependent peptidase
MFNYSNIILPNGIRLISIKKDTGVVSVHMGMKIGPLYEKRSQKGISHFVEHMLYKGTKTRTNEKLNSDLENLGGEYNAYTDHNCTVYSATALCSEVENILEIFSDMVRNSTFPDDEIEKEKEVILSEIRCGRDDLEQYSFKRINEIAFKSSPLKYETVGESKTVKKFSRQELLEFRDRYYVPNNCFISVVSPYEHEFVKDLVTEHFGSWMEKELDLGKVRFEKNIPVKETSYKKNIEQSTILYLFTFQGISKQEEMALKVFNHKFGESSNSILFRELREDRGLAYDIYTHLDLTQNVKTLYLYTAVGEENVQEALDIIESCISRVKNEEIVFDENTVMLMKKVLNTAVAFTLEDSTDIGNYVLHQLIEGESVLEFVEDMERLEGIRKEDIYSIAAKVLDSPTIHILKNED